MTDFCKNVRALFTRNRWRYTVGVQNIACILRDTETPLSVKEIEVLCQRKNTPIDTTTIYRNLEKFISLGLVHELGGTYMRCDNPENTKSAHHFLVCKECGKAEEVFLDYFPSIAHQLKKEKGFVLTKVNMQFEGVCRNCAKA